MQTTIQEQNYYYMKKYWNWVNTQSHTAIVQPTLYQTIVLNKVNQCLNGTSSDINSVLTPINPIRITHWLTLINPIRHRFKAVSQSSSPISLKGLSSTIDSLKETQLSSTIGSLLLLLESIHHGWQHPPLFKRKKLCAEKDQSENGMHIPQPTNLAFRHEIWWHGKLATTGLVDGCSVLPETQIDGFHMRVGAAQDLSVGVPFPYGSCWR